MWWVGNGKREGSKPVEDQRKQSILEGEPEGHFPFPALQSGADARVSEICVSKSWVNFKVLCGWRGCGPPACVRLKVAEIAGLEVGRGGWGETQAEHPGSHGPLLCLP